MRIALTGAATGIGAATAARFKSGNAEIVAFDIAEPRDNVDQWIAFDLSKPATIAQAAEAADGPFDALINVAGLPPRQGQEEAILAVNYFGLVTFTEAMLAKLRPDGTIVNVASKAGGKWRDNIDQVKALMSLSGPEDLPGFIDAERIDYVRAYDLSKEAVIVWSKARCERLMTMGLRVNTVSPAAIATRILGDFIAAFEERATKAIARVGRPGTPEEVAEVIFFLAARQSGWIRGIDIAVDGGTNAMAEADALALGD